MSTEMIGTYVDQLLVDRWVEWSEGVLSSIPVGDTSFQDVVGAENSDERSRARECFTIGLLRGPLTSRVSPLGWEMLERGEAAHSKLGFLAYALARHRKHAQSFTQTHKRAFSALCTLFALQIGADFGGGFMQLSSIFLHIMDSFPGVSGLDEDSRLRHLAAGMFSMCHVGEGRPLLTSFLEARSVPELVILTDSDGGGQVRHVLTPRNYVDKISSGEILLAKTVPRKPSLYWVGRRGLFNFASELGIQALSTIARRQRESFASTGVNPLVELLAKPESVEPPDPIRVIADYAATSADLSSEWSALMQSLYEGVLESLSSLRPNSRIPRVFFAIGSVEGDIRAQAIQVSVPIVSCPRRPEPGDHLAIADRRFVAANVRTLGDTAVIDAAIIDQDNNNA